MTSCRAPGPVASARFRALRFPLTPLERQRLRELGRTLVRAVEAPCRNSDLGETEADIAGHPTHRLIREGVEPANLRIAGDDRLRLIRQPISQAALIRRRATIVASGRRHGPCASLTRRSSMPVAMMSSPRPRTGPPKVEVEVKGFLMTRPGVLGR